MNTIDWGQAAVNNTIGFGQGALTGGTPFSNTKSIELDGIDDFIRVNDSDNLSFGNASTDSAFSVSAWVKMTDATRFRIVSKMTDSSNMEYAFFTSASDQLYFALYDVTSSNRISRFTSSTLTSYEGQWIHLVATYSGGGSSGGLKIYLDNVRIDDSSSDVGSYTAMHNLSVSFKIGKYDTSTSNGLIDEVSIFNSELSQSDITSIYNGGVPTSLSSYSSLVSWWRCGDNDTAPTLTDNGSGGNDGTMTNFSTFSTDVPT